jgi:hypothetical protein
MCEDQRSLWGSLQATEMVSGGGIYSHHSQGHRENNTNTDLHELRRLRPLLRPLPGWLVDVDIDETTVATGALWLLRAIATALRY